MINPWKWLLGSLALALTIFGCDDSLDTQLSSPAQTFHFMLNDEEIVLTPCDEGVDLPLDQLPKDIAEFLTDNYPQRSIIEVEEYDGGFIEVELVGDLDLYFDPSGALMGIDEIEENNTEILDALLSLARKYLQDNHPDLLSAIDEVDLEYRFGEWYLEIEFDDDGEMIFNAQGTLLCAYDDEDWMEEDDDDEGYDDDDYIDPNQLPQAILDYIAQNYPNVTITKAERDDDDYYYEVYLSNGLELYFDLEGNLIEEDDDDDSDDDEGYDDDEDEWDDSDDDEGYDDDDDYIDPDQLPQAILDYIAQNYPNVTITKAERDDDDYYYEVYLSNGLELYFDLEGNLIEEDDDDDEGYDDGEDEWDDSDDDEGYDDDDYIDPDQLPQAILDYIAQNYPNVTITKAERDDDDYYYEVYLSNGLELYFDLEGNLIEEDDDDDSDDDEGYDDDEDEWDDSDDDEGYDDDEDDWDDSDDDEGYDDNEDEWDDSDDDEGYDDDDYIDPDQLPQAILDYIAQNYPNVPIAKAEREDDDHYYEVYLSNGLELYFDLEGNFLGTD